MPDLPFTWDPKKARRNLAKHRVSFEEASTVFYDEQGLEMEDPEMKRAAKTVSSSSG